ncbi:hypothetical protein J3L18_00285 [Mucilaginibacter gossypii]|uniref:hypothetical protein n=1 Tax=Mucilaginibacter gossypii TaxID=551996 RepID=UPI000DCE1DA8|nr:MULTISPECIES: hypothetical protein [Mucilaginibacter]QTE37540.1 hypothetical protein J3L18_00285 [Mucilaginibacter gossypii]RAV54272.1 hypothetical protein DIU36_21120 [Mucilaginibacter rubeus]
MTEQILKTTQGKLRVRIPTQLNEVTLGQLMDLQARPDITDLEAISILSGIPVIELHNIKNYDDLHLFGDAVLSLSYQIKHLYNSNEIPKEVIFMLSGDSGAPFQKTKVKVMQNLSVEPAGAFMAARDIIAEEINAHIKTHGEDDWQEHFNPSLNACCQVLAQYFYCRATGKKYDEYEVEGFMDEVKKLRVTEALPISKHFFTCYPSLSMPRISFWHRLLPYWKKRQGSSRSKNLNTSTL